MAEVHEGSSPRIGAATGNGGGETVYLMAQMLRGANALDVTATIHERLPALRDLLPAARERARPVLMTALVAALGFLPMALATGVGAEVQRPLATVVVGGLLTSTLLTLVILPSVYPRLASLFRARPKQTAATT